MNCKKVILSLLKRTKSIEEINEVQAFIEDVNTKLDKLVSGTNIKTINGLSLLGEGDITVADELADVATSGDYDDLINKPELDDMSLVIASALNDLNSRLSNCVLSEVVHNVVVCTQAEYDTLVTNNEVDPNTEYNII